MRGLCIVAGLVAAAVPSTSSATWSIVAVDPETREVGIAGASCVPGIAAGDPIPVTGLVPGIGVVAAQAAVHDPGRERAIRRLSEGRTPQDVITEIASAAFDPDFEQRQYGVAALLYPPAAFTGADTQDVKATSLGEHHSVQGNILREEAVIGAAFNAFGSIQPCPTTLADRLLIALEAGGAAGGDSRCSAEQTALIAWLEVAGPDDEDDAPSIQFVIPSQAMDGPNPVELLRAEYDAWRMTNPRDDSMCGGGTDGGTDGGSAGSASGTSTSTTSTAGTESAGETATSSATTPGTGTADATTPAATGDGDDGCGCRGAKDRPGVPGALLVAGLAVGAALRRRPTPTASSPARRSGPARPA